MVREIPKTVEVTCDACGVVIKEDDRKVLRNQNGRIIIKRDAIDWYGCAVADGSLSFDLCDKCLDQIVSAIGVELDYIKNGKKKEEGNG